MTSFHNTTSSSFHCNAKRYTKFQLSDSVSDIRVFIKEYKDRMQTQIRQEEANYETPFISFAKTRLSDTDIEWLQDNDKRFFKNVPNKEIVELNFLSESGFISSMLYSPDGDYIIVGFSTGLLQEVAVKMDVEKDILKEYATKVDTYYNNVQNYDYNIPAHFIWYPMFYQGKIRESINNLTWVKNNYEQFLKGTKNEVVYNRWYSSEAGAITALVYAPNGTYIVAGHWSGLIQMRHGSTGVVLSTLRNIQFPPKPVYAIVFSQSEERICYAAYMDGIIYRIEIPNIVPTGDDVPEYCIRADPALECLNVQFYGAPGILSYATPLITQRSAPLSLGITSDQSKMIVGYADASIKVYDMETQEAHLTYKVHKLRLQFIPKKLQRIHCGQVCALKCHGEKPYTFASAGWDRTLRIWDIRCKVGCVTTFEGVNICSDSIDLNRDHCIAGSWQPTEALTVWDLVARKRLNIVRVQNRRPNVDGEYIYACQYWKSGEFNRKGKYGIIGGSGTNCVEVINLHNRYITCSYPAAGTILAITSHNSKIAFGGTAPVFNIVSFFDPKHEKDKYEIPDEPDYDNTKVVVTLYDDEDDIRSSEGIDDVKRIKSVMGAKSLIGAKSVTGAASTFHPT